MTPVQFTISAPGSSNWVMPTYSISPFELQIVTTVTGTVSYNVEYTEDDFFTPSGCATIPWPPAGTPTVVAALSASTTSASTSINFPVRGWRVTLVSGTGSVKVQGAQAGITN